MTTKYKAAEVAEKLDRAIALIEEAHKKLLSAKDIVESVSDLKSTIRLLTDPARDIKTLSLPILRDWRNAERNYAKVQAHSRGEGTSEAVPS